MFGCTSTRPAGGRLALLLVPWAGLRAGSLSRTRPSTLRRCQHLLRLRQKAKEGGGGGPTARGVVPLQLWNFVVPLPGRAFGRGRQKTRVPVEKYKEEQARRGAVRGAHVGADRHLPGVEYGQHEEKQGGERKTRVSRLPLCATLLQQRKRHRGQMQAAAAAVAASLSRLVAVVHAGKGGGFNSHCF